MGKNEVSFYLSNIANQTGIEEHLEHMRRAVIATNALNMELYMERKGLFFSCL